MNKPLYTQKPIGHVNSLAKLLDIDEAQLIFLAETANSFYYLHKRRKKPDGTFREIYGVCPTLKILQKRINHKIFYNINFPPYLHGAIKDTASPRNHITDAEIHMNAALIVKMDISNFFPSLTSKLIFNIWKSFFNFSDPVAKLLAKLTTYNSFLPQGAPTSSYLANLAFWDIEPGIVEKLTSDGFRYTRYIDDITISSKTYKKKEKLEPIFSSVFGMFRLKGVKPNRKKINISTSGHNMSIHNLNVNSSRPTIPKAGRSRIRAAVRQCEIDYLKDSSSKTYEELWNRTRGRVNYLRGIHPDQAQIYIGRLEAIKPTS